MANLDFYFSKSTRRKYLLHQ